MSEAPLIAGGPRDEVFVLDRRRFEIRLAANHADFAMAEPIVSALLRHAGGWEAFARKTAILVRRAIDEVIDTARTNRFRLADTEKTEKTYLGTKIEILFRSMLKLSKGRNLDLSVDGADVDIKNTMWANWAIPLEAIGRPCVLIRENEKTALCSVGIVIAMDAYLNPGGNRDGKRAFSKEGQKNIWWILKDLPYPPNIWEMLSEDERARIMTGRGGSERLSFLFEMLRGRPLQRSVVEHVAQQKDPMKRIRRNGGARDILAPKGIAVFYGPNDRKIIAQLRLPELANDEFISHSPRDATEEKLLRSRGDID